MFRFSIREVLLVTALVAVSLGWWLEHRDNKNLRYENDALDRSLKLTTYYLESALDYAREIAIRNGEPMLVPIYADEEEAKELKVRTLSSD